MPHYSSGWILGSGIFNLALAVFHMAFWRLFRWPESLGTLGHVNRRILYILNLAVTALFLLMGVLLLVFPAEFAVSDLGLGLLIGMTLFWMGRAALQPVMFGLKRPLSLILFAVFLLGGALHGLAASLRNGM